MFLNIGKYAKMSDMEITKTHKIIVSILAVILLFGTYIAFDSRSKISQDEEDVVNTSEEIATTTSSSNTQTITNSDGTIYTIEKVAPPVAKVVPKPIPDLNRVVIKSPLANVSEKDYLTASTKVKEYQTLLKNDPTLIPVWLDMAMYQNIGGDYEGAIISWKYVALLDPANYVSLANIGNTYAYYLKDNAQTEIYYKKAIEKGSTVVYLYYQLAEIYVNIFKDPAKARAIIDLGLQRIPNDPVLLEFKASLQ